MMEKTQLSNHWKGNMNEHPIYRVLIGFDQMKKSQANSRSMNYKSQTKNIIQRQRVIRSFLNKPDDNEPTIRKPITLRTTPNALSITSISSPQLLFAELNEQSTYNNNRQQTIKKQLDPQSPILIRRQYPTTENCSSHQQVSDNTNTPGNQLSISTPSSFTFRNKPSRVLLSDRSSFKIEQQLSSPRLKPLNYSKTISEGNFKQNIFHPKTPHQNTSLATHTRTPRLLAEGSNHIRTLTSDLRAKSHLSKYLINRFQPQLQSERMYINPKTNSIQDLSISTRGLNNLHPEYEMNKKMRNIRVIIGDWDDPKSNHDGISDDDESVSADGNSSTSTCNSQVSVQQDDRSSSLSPLSHEHDLFSSPSFFHDNSKTKTPRSSIKRNISRRWMYNLALPTVAEYLDDKETDDEFH